MIIKILIIMVFYFSATGGIHADEHTTSSVGRVTIITAEQLASDLNRFSIIDARGYSSFEEGHIPNAQPTEWEEWTLEYPGPINLIFGSPYKWGLVPEPSQQLEKKLRLLGLSNTKPIVVVGDSTGMGGEGRVVWCLLYWGAQKVSLLDGGFSAWSADPHRPVESRSTPKKVTEGTFSINIQPDRLADYQYVLSAINDKNRLIVDVRTQEEFDGSKLEWGQERGGHIPNATFVAFKSLYNDDGSYISMAGLYQLIGKQTDESPIAYCTGGVRSALFVVLYEARTGKKAINYSGSLWEWSANPDLPLVQVEKDSFFF